MILLRLFWVFSYIGLFNFGGGYAMISFIQSEVVGNYHWMTEGEFTDIVAISQMTPGPIGINAATYAGYTSVVNDAWMNETFASTPLLLQTMGVIGSVIATFSVIWLPFIVMILVSKIILRYKNHIITTSIFEALRPAVVGLLISASLCLLTDIDIHNIADITTLSGNFGISKANFGAAANSPLGFALSIAIFIVVLLGARRYKWNLIYTLLASAALGIVAFGVIGL